MNNQKLMDIMRYGNLVNDVQEVLLKRPSYARGIPTTQYWTSRNYDLLDVAMPSYENPKSHERGVLTKKYILRVIKKYKTTTVQDTLKVI